MKTSSDNLASCQFPFLRMKKANNARFCVSSETETF